MRAVFSPSSPAWILLLFAATVACSEGGTNSTEPDASCLAVDASFDDAGKIVFMSPCDPCDTSECSSGLCFNFAAKGSRCTTPCSNPNDCPLPSTGCSNMGVCKAP